MYAHRNVGALTCIASYSLHSFSAEKFLKEQWTILPEGEFRRIPSHPPRLATVQGYRLVEYKI